MWEYPSGIIKQLACYSLQLSKEVIRVVEFTIGLVLWKLD